MANDIHIILVGLHAIKTNHGKIKSVNPKFEDTIKTHLFICPPFMYPFLT